MNSSLPSDDSRRESRIAEALLEYYRRIDQGRPVSQDDFADEYADVADDLREHWETEQAVNHAASEMKFEERSVPAIAGERIRYFGEYELLDEIDRGGMGIVFRARQLRLNRLVAVKMLRPELLDDAEYLARFQIEAHAAAQLKHANIVGVYDVNQHEGRHYIAMEYVPGVTLKKRLDDGPLPPDEAARIMALAADAVQFAHSRQVLHRDIKPGNILLDEQHAPHLTDFGLARLMGDGAELTKTGQAIGTASYMSPEQAGAQPDAIDLRTDVYGLGATLYALLTGRPPFQSAWADETIWQVKHEEPASLRTVNRAVPKDLETVCLKCLEKSPDSRYASAAELADELRRYLNHEPIRARPAGLVRRLSKWARRRPAVAGLSAALAATLLVASVVSTAMYLRTETARQNAEANLDRANFNLSRAVDVVNFLSSDVAGEIGELPHLEGLHRRILEKSLVFNEALAAENTEDPALQFEVAQANQRVGGLQKMLGQHVQARQAHLRAAELFQSLDDRESTPRTWTNLANAWNGLWELESSLGRFEEADAYLQKMQAIHDRLPADHQDSEAAQELESLLSYNQALHLQRQGRSADALTAWKELVPLRRARLDAAPDDPRRMMHLAEAYGNLGVAARRSGAHDEACQASEQALPLLERCHVQQPNDWGLIARIGTMWRNLAIARRHLKQFEPALAALHEANERFETLLGYFPEQRYWRSELAEVQHGTALCMVENGLPAEAIKFLKSGLEELRKLPPSATEELQVRQSLRNQLHALVEAYAQTGDHQQSAATVEEFLAAAYEPFDQPHAAIGLVNCAKLARQDNRLSADEQHNVAEGYELRAVDILRNAKDKRLIDARYITERAEFAELRSRPELQALLKAEASPPAAP